MAPESLLARHGITLVEVMIAVAILGVLIAAVIPSFLSYLRVNTQSEMRSQAVAAAETVMDSIRGERRWLEEGDPRLADRRRIDVGGRTYEVLVDHDPYCEADGPCYDDVRDVRLEVRFNGRTYYEVATVFTRLD